MPLVRKHNWQTILHNYIHTQANSSFKYGTFDCCLFVAGCIHAMTDVDLAEPLRGSYSSRKEAMQAVKTYCGKASVRAVVEKVATEHGLQIVPPLCAQRGDMVLIKRGRDYSLGLVSLSGRDIYAAGEHGIVRLPLTAAVKAWRI